MLEEMKSWVDRFSPVKMLSLMLIIMAFIDHLTEPLFLVGYEKTFLTETLMRIVFFFIGFFGLLGNGRTKEVRARIVSMPFAYLASLYVIKYYHSMEDWLLLPLSILLVLTLWIVLIGAKYE
jgi:hypothetical protein